MIRDLNLTLLSTLVAIVSGTAVSAQQSPRPVRFDTVAIVGVEEGSERETFGAIHTIVARPNGEFFVLDLQASSVSWFGANGVFKDAITSRGGGPGELAGAADLAVASNGDLYVLEARNGRVSVFRTAGDSIVFVRSRPNVLGGRNFCALGSRLFINVIRDDQSVHELTDSPNSTLAFGAVVKPEGLDGLGAFRPMAESMLLAGRIMCSQQPAFVISASTSQPYVRAFQPDGRPAWNTTLTAFYPARYEISNTGGLRSVYDARTGAHIGQTLTRWADGTILVQYEIRRSTPVPDGRDYHAIESRVLDIRTGAEIERRTDLPLIVATAGQFVYSRRNQPFPQVIVLRRR